MSEDKDFSHKMSELLKKLLGDENPESFKKRYAEGLDSNGIIAPSDHELNLMRGYFIDYAVVQLLKLYSVSTYKDKSDYFLDEFVNLFITNMRYGILQKMEIDELVGEHSTLEDVVGKDLVEKERNLARQKADLLLTRFSTDIKEVLDINLTRNDMSDDDLKLF